MISERAISGIVLADIRKYVGIIAVDEPGLREHLIAQRNAETTHKQKADKAQAKALQKRLSELEQLIPKLFEEMVLGSLSESVCHSMIAKYEQEKRDKFETLEAVNRRLELLAQDEQDVESFLAAIKRYVSVDSLDRSMLLELIDNIEIGKVTGTGKEKTRGIVIHYKFVGNVHGVVP